jgi:hypothetical protein
MMLILMMMMCDSNATMIIQMYKHDGFI